MSETPETDAPEAAAPKAPGWLDRLRGSPTGAGLLLGLFSCAAALILAAGFEATKEAIATRATEDLYASLGQVLPTTLYDNDPTSDLRVITDAEEGEIQVYVAAQGDQISGVAFELIGFGYAGGIKVLIGITPEGTLLGARVLAHAETPGLGDKIEIRKDDWIEDFTGRSLTNPDAKGWAVKADGGIFDQFSGATITPRAVVTTVHRGLKLFERHRSALLAPLPQEAGS